MKWPSFEAALAQSGVILEPSSGGRPLTLSEALRLLRELEAGYQARRERWNRPAEPAHEVED